jgi:hypothetical protein
MPDWGRATKPFEFHMNELGVVMRSSSPTASSGSVTREIRYFQEQLSHAHQQLAAAHDQAEKAHWGAMVRRYETVLELYQSGRLAPAAQGNGANDRSFP